MTAAAKAKVLHIKAADSTIEHLTVQHSGSNLFDMDAGIFADRTAHNIRIHHNHARDNLFGIYVWGPEKGIVEHNTVTGQTTGRTNDRGNGIQLWKSLHTIIRNNTISGGRDGIYVTNSKYNLFENNTISRHPLRHPHMYTEDSEVKNNHLSDLESAYVIMFSNRITVRDNESDNSREHGLMLNAVNQSNQRQPHQRSQQMRLPLQRPPERLPPQPLQ